MAQEDVTYLLAYLSTLFSRSTQEGLDAWEREFERACRVRDFALARRLLQQVKQQPLTTEGKAVILAMAGKLYGRMGQWEEAHAAYQQSLTLWPDCVAALLNLANLVRIGQPNSAIELYQRALARAPKTWHAAILNGLALSYEQLGELTQAYQTFLGARSRLLAADDTAGLASVEHNLGSLAWTRGQLTTAQEHFEQALVYTDMLGDALGSAETRNSLGLIYEARGEWDEALQLYQAALERLQSAEHYHLQAHVMTNMGNVLTLQKQYATARQCFENGLIIARDLGDGGLEGQLLTGLGDCYVEQAQWDEAERTLFSALEQKQAGGQLRSLKHTWLSLGFLYFRQQRAKEATHYYMLALTAARSQNDSRVSTEVTLKLAEMAFAEEKMGEAAQWLDQAEAVVGEQVVFSADIFLLRGMIAHWQGATPAELYKLYDSAMAFAQRVNQQKFDEVSATIQALLSADIAEDKRDD